MTCITSVNIACGFHAGDAVTMREMVALARKYRVAVGAHPSFPDREGFGRRDVDLPPADVESIVLYQVAALAAIAGRQGVKLQHVKPHGALFNMAARDGALADAVARATAAVDRGLVLFGPPGSALIEAGRRMGLRTANEVFADRAYRPDMSLMPRAEKGAVIADPESVVARALMMVRDHRIVATDGQVICLDADTICVHGDTPGAADLARRVRDALIAAGIEVRAISAP